MKDVGAVRVKQPTPFTPQVAEDLRQVDGVEAVMQERFGAAQFDGSESFFAAVDPSTLDRTLRLDYTAGGTDGLEGDGLLVAITEQRSRADIDRLAQVLGAAVAAEREGVAA